MVNAESAWIHIRFTRFLNCTVTTPKSFLTNSHFIEFDSLFGL